MNFNGSKKTLINIEIIKLKPNIIMAKDTQVIENLLREAIIVLKKIDENTTPSEDSEE